MSSCVEIKGQKGGSLIGLRNGSWSYYVNSFRLVCVPVCLGRGPMVMAHCKSLKRAERLSPKRECSQLCLAWECMCVGERECASLWLLCYDFVCMSVCSFMWCLFMFCMCEHYIPLSLRRMKRIMITFKGKKSVLLYVQFFCVASRYRALIRNGSDSPWKL